eukprot:scaffold11665_cov48-Cyclotella_meneghiniana.AAC.5
MCFPVLGSRRHPSSVETCIRSSKIMRILIPERNWNIVQDDACCGNGNILLNRMRRSVSSLQYHAGLLPNDLDGTSCQGP